MPAIYMSDRNSIRQVGVLQLASAFGVCLGAQKQSLRFFFFFLVSFPTKGSDPEGISGQ